jgi:GNAT superfamily N-acetyltransferase
MIEFRDTLTVDSYNHLRKSAGWTEVEPRQAQIGINNSACLIAAYDSEECVGCLRVVSDGGYTAIIVDVLVLPEYQRSGIGKEMMARSLEFLGKPLEKGQMVMVNLMAAQGKEPFYDKFGFEARPNQKSGAGMVLYLRGTNPDSQSSQVEG